MNETHKDVYRRLWNAIQEAIDPLNDDARIEVLEYIAMQCDVMAESIEEERARNF